MSKRLTVPDNSTAIILPNQLASELFALCKLLRKPKQNLKDREDMKSVQAIASEVLLALIDGGISE